MNLVEFIFEIIKRFVHIDERKLKRLEGDGEKWYDENITSKVDEQTSNPVFKLLRQYGEEWYVQTGLAVFFLFAVRWVSDFMTASDEVEQ
jgi:hypothetical protein